MAKEKKPAKRFIVLKDFTFDKLYRKGQVFETENAKALKELITNKLIK
jgi:hypothetical protein